MAMNMKLRLAVLISSGIFVIACSQTDPPPQTPGNVSPPPPTVVSSTIAPPVPSSTFVPPQTGVNSNVVAPRSSNANPAQDVPTATIRARDVKAIAGRDVTVEIELESKVDITVMVFSLDFDPSVLTYVSSKLSTGAPTSAVLTVNAEKTAEGKFGAIMDSAVAFAIGRKPVMTVVFRVAPDAPVRDHQINFSSKPARQSVSTIQEQLVDTKFESGTVRVNAPR